MNRLCRSRKTQRLDRRASVRQANKISSSSNPKIQTSCESETTCDALGTEDVCFKERLTDIGEILTHLAINCPQQQSSRIHDRRISHYEESSTISKIKMIMRIYQTVLNASPLDCRLIYRKNSDSSHSYDKNTLFNILIASQQVLDYIESLPGYCDLINSLRLILKSTRMVNVMIAYDTLIRGVAMRLN